MKVIRNANYRNVNNWALDLEKLQAFILYTMAATCVREYKAK